MGPTHLISFAPSGPVATNGISTTHLPSFAGTIAWHRRHPQVRTRIALTGEDLQWIERQARRIGPQVAVLESVAVGEALPVFRSLGIPVIIDMHNIEADLYRAIRRQRGFAPRLEDLVFGARRSRAMVRFDRDASLQATETWVTSTADRDQLLALGGARAVVIPNPIPNEHLARLALDAERYRSPRILFVGHLSYRPNMAAVRELAGRIWPMVRGGHAEASLLIGGRRPTPAIVGLGREPGIDVIADPEDLEPLYQACGYALMPIRQGGGTRLKVLEAMVAGTVVIGTAKAVEGLGLTSGEHYIEAERPAEFHRHLTALCASPETTAALAGRARRFALAEFGASRLSAQIQERIGRLAGGRRPDRN